MYLRLKNEQSDTVATRVDTGHTGGELWYMLGADFNIMFVGISMKTSFYKKHELYFEPDGAELLLGQSSTSLAAEETAYYVVK